MAVRGDGLVPDDADNNGGEAPAVSQKVTYVIHPNCALEEDL